MIRQTKVLVVGQGLAGSVLAVKLLQNNIPFLLINDPSGVTSSKVAGGIINPIIFRHLTMSWRAKELWTTSSAFYSNFDKRKNTNTFNYTKIVRVFNESEQQKWSAKIKSPLFNQFLKLEDQVVLTHLPVETPFGFGTVDPAAWLDTASFLDAANDDLKKNDCVINESLDHKQLIIEPNRVFYKNISAEFVVFCEGHHLKSNPWFGHVPLQPVKGELLTIEANLPDFRMIINGDVFILPLGNGRFKIGSTYDWNDETELPTEATRESLLQKLRKILKSEVQVVDHQAGIRPAIADRKPVAGFHPVTKNLLVMNGLGSKGVMIAPFLADYVIKRILGENEIDAEIDISRFNRFLT